MALVNCPECNNKVSERASACPHCGYAVVQHFVESASGLPPLVQAFKCPCCGAEVAPRSTDCQFCGSHLQVMAATHHIQCASCQADLVEGQSFCHACGALQFMTEQLRHIATKVQFSQKKLRDSFLPEIRQQFSPDEFIHAHTYGPEEYYILSDRRVYVAAINSRGLFVRKYELGGLKHVIDMQRTTRITDWSELWYGQFDEEAANPFMSLQIETFDGDFNLVVNAFQSNTGFFYDPYYFQSLLEEVFNNLQNRQVHQSESLWRAKA